MTMITGPTSFVVEVIALVLVLRMIHYMVCEPVEEEEEIPLKQFLVTYRIYAQDMEDAKCIAEETKDDMYYNNDFDPEIVSLTEIATESCSYPSGSARNLAQES